MQKLWARQALLPSGWADNVSVAIDGAGRISDVKSGTDPQAEQVGVLLPALVNVHSHAFQRAMAGLSERRGPTKQDSFWTWRKLMFTFLDHLTPDHVQAITAFVQMEMLESGYATNAEFHYLHHQPGGAPYAALAEMCDRVMAAAGQTGIGLCLLPVQYQFGGCDARALAPGQVRFGTTPDQFNDLYTAAAKALGQMPQDAGMGVAPHSLRAVGQDSLRRIHQQFPTGPIHMHLAEQTAEVDEVQSQWGLRPVQWALENMDIGDRHCLIHCTQMTPSETKALAATGAVAGLCPITESSLGDGIFDGVRWLQAGGRIAIGSDSNIRIAVSEELRTFDYSQRLRDGTRASSATPDKSTGRRLYDASLGGGAQATQRDCGAIEAGRWADLLVLDDRHVHLDGLSGDMILDSWIFAGDDQLVTDVWSAGRRVVQNGRHHSRDAIEAAYRVAIRDLRDKI